MAGLATQSKEQGTTQEKKPSTTPWKPAKILEGIPKRAGFRRYWATRDKLDKKLSEGWEVVKGAEGAAPVTLIDGTKLTNCITRRNLVLVEMPEEMVQSRAEYFHEMNKMGLEGVKKEFEDEAKKAGIPTYGTGSTTKT